MVEDKKTPKKKILKWGEDGFTGEVNFGCYKYKILYTHQSKIRNIVDIDTKVYGALSYDDQLIVIGSNLSEQLKKLTTWHELMHVMLKNNNVNDGKDEVKVDDEGFTDTMASRIYELTTRNPEMMRWLLK